MTTSRSPLLDLAVAEPQGPAGGAVEGLGPDAGVAAHYGRPLPEQRALARAAPWWTSPTGPCSPCPARTG